MFFLHLDVVVMVYFVFLYFCVFLFVLSLSLPLCFYLSFIFYKGFPVLSSLPGGEIGRAGADDDYEDF